MKAITLAAMLALVVGCGGRDQPDDPAFHSDVQSHAAGAEVTFDATVQTPPVESGGHERLVVTATTGELVEIDHNTTLAAWVPAHRGDRVVVHGQLYIDPGRIGVHCTHAHTSQGCPSAGWIELGGNYYE